MAAAKAALLTELGRVLGCSVVRDSRTTAPARRGLPAELYYRGPFDPAPPRKPVVSLAPPTMMERQARMLAEIGEERRMRFILARRRPRAGGAA